MDQSLSSNHDQTHILEQEISGFSYQWKPEHFEFSPHQFESSLDNSRPDINISHPDINNCHQNAFDSQQDVSFTKELPIQSKIHQPILDIQQAFDLQPSIQQEKKVINVIQVAVDQLVPNQPLPQTSFHADHSPPLDRKGSPPLQASKPPSSLSSQGNKISQVTITLHQQSLRSKVYDQFDTQDSSSFSSTLRSFLNLNGQNYRPHVLCMKFLFKQLKEHSLQSLQNMKLYLNFLQVKIKQELSSLKMLDQLQGQQQAWVQQKGEDQSDDQQLNMDEKVLIGQLRMQNTRRVKRRRTFYADIKTAYENMLQLWRKTKQRRMKREKYIEQEIIRVLDRIEMEMEDMIKCRLMNQREQQDKFVSQKIRSQNPYLMKDKYLQMKYLMQREAAYLKLLNQFNGKIITYMVSMFSQQEPSMAKIIKEALLEYATSYMQCYSHDNTVLNLKIETLQSQHCQNDIKNQLAERLLSCIPIQLFDINERVSVLSPGQERLDRVLADFSASLQNMIFLNTLDMNNDFILFRNEALWKTNSSFMQTEEVSIDIDSKQVLSSSRTMANVKSGSEQFGRREDIRITVVLTSNYFLHLEHEEKIATVKLGEVKLSKKGNEVIVAERGKGIGSYFGFRQQLGRMVFQSSQEVQTFASKLQLAMKRLSFG